MIEEKYLELIQADVDGELPEQHRADLARYLLANPEARALRDDLRRLHATLARVPAVEPPADLEAAILSAAPIQPARAPGGAGPRGFWSPARTFRYAAALAGGLLVGSLVYQLGADGETATDASLVVGTLASPPSLANATPGHTIQVSLDSVHGQISLLQSAGRQVVQFDLAAERPVEVVVVHGGQESRYAGFGPAAGGVQHFTMALDAPAKAGEQVEVRLIEGGRVIQQGQLAAAAN